MIAYFWLGACSLFVGFLLTRLATTKYTSEHTVGIWFMTLIIFIMGYAGTYFLTQLTQLTP